MLESDAFNKLHSAVVCTCEEVVEHASDELLPGGRWEVQNQLLCDELVIKIWLKVYNEDTHDTYVISVVNTLNIWAEYKALSGMNTSQTSAVSSRTVKMLPDVIYY